MDNTLAIWPISLFSLFFFFTHTTSNTCAPSSCLPTGSPRVQFPFKLFARQPDRCGYDPGYTLLCNNKNQTILNLPSGEVIVKRIFYPDESIIIDPQFCLPNRINEFTLDGTPFFNSFSTSVTFFNCSPAFVERRSAALTPVKFNCLSGPNHTVFALPTYYPTEVRMPASCRHISTIKIPVMGYEELSSRWELELRWFPPEYEHTQGFPRSALYGLIFGLGAPSVLLCIIVLTYFINKKVSAQTHSRQQPGIDLSSISINPRPTPIMGLDGPTIESYPITVVGESGRLPKPNDNICPICLLDYQPKDELRTIPECHHYYHAECIDEWLRLNATCPVCRNTQESSSAVVKYRHSPASTSSGSNTES